jgi:hypothetical protein
VDLKRASILCHFYEPDLTGHSNQQLISAQERRTERRRCHVLSWVGLGEQPRYLARDRGSSASRRAAIPHDKAVRSWSSASSLNFAAKSTSRHCFAALLRCSQTIGLKNTGQAARLVQRVVHGIEQRQIVQLGTTVNVALRKDASAHPHCFRLTSGL